MEGISESGIIWVLVSILVSSYGDFIKITLGEICKQVLEKVVRIKFCISAFHFSSSWHKHICLFFFTFDPMNLWLFLQNITVWAGEMISPLNYTPVITHTAFNYNWLLDRWGRRWIKFSTERRWTQLSHISGQGDTAKVKM